MKYFFLNQSYHRTSYQSIYDEISTQEFVHQVLIGHIISNLSTDAVNGARYVVTVWMATHKHKNQEN